MSYDDILNELRAKLGDSAEENDKMLKEAAQEYADNKNYDGVKAVGEIMLEIMPEERRDEVRRLTHIDKIRLDDYYNKIVELINEKNLIEAKPMAEKLYKKITEEYMEGETAKFVSLRNPFEDYLYHFLYKPEKVLNRAPFDFATYITTYAYILVDQDAVLDAIPILEKAMEYNPVDCGPKFELAEVYKLLKNKKKLIEITKETLKVASSPVAIARCYANMGYICVETRAFDDAVAFYTASAMMAPHPAVPNELRGIAQMTGKPIKQLTFDEVKAVFAKYEMDFGPDKDVIAVAAQLSSNLLMKKDMRGAVKALKLLYNLTRDEKVKEMILTYDPTAQKVDAEGKPLDEKPNITRTVNENPEE